MVRKTVATVSGALFAFAVLAHDEPQAEKKEAYGHVLFETSCTPEAQKEFEKGLAQLVLTLASDRTGNVVGADFVIDGGLITTL